MTAVDLKVIDLTYHGPVEHQVTRVALLLVYGAREPVPDHLLDAGTTERVAALHRDDRLAEDPLTDGADEGWRLLHELGRLARHGGWSERSAGSRGNASRVFFCRRSMHYRGHTLS